MNKNLIDNIDINLLETYYKLYDSWCSDLWDGQFYVKWLKRNEFFESIKTYDDWISLQRELGLLEDSKKPNEYYLKNLTNNKKNKYGTLLCSKWK